MKEIVLITGAKGFIGRELVSQIKDHYEVRILSRKVEASNEYLWDIGKGELDEAALDQVDHIVHLAGEKLSDGRPLTAERKEQIRRSRIGGADLIREKLLQRGQSISSFISASAIGYYGFTDRKEEIDEEGERGSGFAAELCADWEAAADRFKEEGVSMHVSKIRVSLVLGSGGGILGLYKKLISDHPELALQGDGASYPWNHVTDMAGIFAFALQSKLDGVFNSVAPEANTLQNLYRLLSNHYAKTNFEEIPFSGPRLISKKITSAGYVFQYPSMASAVKSFE